MISFKTLVLLNEGGAAGHMAHPYDIAKSGDDLIKIFNEAVQLIKSGNSSVKIDGINASIRLVNDQFVLDRGSAKPLDIKGIRPEDLEDRFGAGHGFVEKGKKILDIFDTAFPTIKPELKKLGLLDYDNILLNIEYVEGQTNVVQYAGVKNFLAIHGLKSIVPKNVDKFGVVKSRSSSTIPHDNTTMQKLIQKVDKVAKKFGFKVYGNVNVEFTKLPNFSKVLNEKIELNNETKTLKQWLSEIKTIDLPLITRKEYIQISASPKENLNQKQLSDYIIMYATIVLGDELLNSAISPLGNMSDQEGIVVNRKDGSQFKITGSFTIRGLESPFQKN